MFCVWNIMCLCHHMVFAKFLKNYYCGCLCYDLVDSRLLLGAHSPGKIKITVKNTIFKTYYRVQFNFFQFFYNFTNLYCCILISGRLIASTLLELRQYTLICREMLQKIQKNCEKHILTKSKYF